MDGVHDDVARGAIEVVQIGVVHELVVRHFRIRNPSQILVGGMVVVCRMVLGGRLVVLGVVGVGGKRLLESC
jgi:hypothetical protein